MGRRFLGIVVLLLAAWPVAAEVKPNIIFILADDLGYGDLGCYGQKRIKTPHIDRMAKEGLRFTQFYAGSTVCAPSRCCLMTGLHTGHALIRGNGRDPLRPEDITVAKALKEAGYATGLTGKWGLGEEGSTGVPNKQGFDFFYGYLNQHHAHNYYPAYLFRNEMRQQLANEVPGEGDFGKGVATKKVAYSHDLIADEAVAFVKKNHDRPFFLYLAFTTPHANNEAGKEGMEVPDLGEYKDLDWPGQQRHHAAMIARMDRDVGRVFELLRDLNLDEKTIVFFSSDNGPHREGGNDPDFNDSNGPLRGIKRALYDGGIRVPFIVRWPGKVKPGTSDFVGAFWDILPTMTELSGGKPPAGLDGVSIVPTLLGQVDQQKQHDYLYWAFYEGGGGQAVRAEQWKLVEQPIGKPPQLFDLTRDIGEQTDVSAKNPTVVEKLKMMMTEAYKPSDKWKFPEPKK